MKKVFAFLRSSLSSPKKDYNKVKSDLDILRKSVNFLKYNRSKLKAMVEFIRALSSHEEKGTFNKTIASLEKKNYGQLDDALKAFYELNSYLRVARRSKFGHNKAQPDERISSSNVYLGPELGLNLNPVKYWLDNKKDLEEVFITHSDIPGNQPVSKWFCVNRIANNFLETNINAIIENIDIIKKELG